MNTIVSKLSVKLFGNNQVNVFFAGAVSAAGSGSGVTGVTRRGRCKWFNVAKGWGFITPDDGGQDVFVHQVDIQRATFKPSSKVQINNCCNM